MLVRNGRRNRDMASAYPLTQFFFQLKSRRPRSAVCAACLSSAGKQPGRWLTAILRNGGAWNSGPRRTGLAPAKRESRSVAVVGASRRSPQANRAGRRGRAPYYCFGSSLRFAKSLCEHRLAHRRWHCRFAIDDCRLTQRMSPRKFFNRR
jgi:hypothetical protein